MEECIFFVTHVDKGGVKSGHQFLDFCQIDIADRIRDIARLFLQRHKARILEQSE